MQIYADGMITVDFHFNSGLVLKETVTSDRVLAKKHRVKFQEEAGNK